MPFLPDFRLEAYMSKWEFSARFNLTSSDAESISLSYLLALAAPEDRRNFEHIGLGYLPPSGSPALREAIASTYETVPADNILCFSGGQEGIYVVMNALLEAGDHVIVITPIYQSMETLAISICSATGVPLDPACEWSLDLASLREAVRPNTKLVVMNFPNNPTGKILDRPTFDSLVNLCRERGLWLLSDEVYRSIERDVRNRLPQAVDYYERGISLNVMSKVYGLPGLRIGWVAARDRGLLQKMERIKHYLSICNAGPSEALAVIALGARTRLLESTRRLITGNLRKLDTFFSGYPDLFDWTLPEGGTVGFPKYKGLDGVETFTRKLVEEANVLMLPASVFHSDLNPTPTDRFRIGYARSGLEEGLEVMSQWLADRA